MISDSVWNRIPLTVVSKISMPLSSAQIALSYKSPHVSQMAKPQGYSRKAFSAGTKGVDIYILFIKMPPSVLWKLSWFIWPDIAPKGVAFQSHPFHFWVHSCLVLNWIFSSSSILSSSLFLRRILRAEFISSSSCLLSLSSCSRAWSEFRARLLSRGFF